MHHEEKFNSLFLYPFTGFSCMFSIVNWQTCQWLICLGLRPPHLVLALAFPYLTRVSGLSLIREMEWIEVYVWNREIRKKESERECWPMYIEFLRDRTPLFAWTLSKNRNLYWHISWGHTNTFSFTVRPTSIWTMAPFLAFSLHRPS